VRRAQRGLEEIRTGHVIQQEIGRKDKIEKSEPRHPSVSFQHPSLLCVFIFEHIFVSFCVWLTSHGLRQAATWLCPFHLARLSRSLLLRPLLPFSLSCPLLRLAGQAHHWPPLLLPPLSPLGPPPWYSSVTVSSCPISVAATDKSKSDSCVCALSQQEVSASGVYL